MHKGPIRLTVYSANSDMNHVELADLVQAVAANVRAISSIKQSCDQSDQPAKRKSSVITQHGAQQLRSDMVHERLQRPRGHGGTNDGDYAISLASDVTTPTWRHSPARGSSNRYPAAIEHDNAAIGHGISSHATTSSSTATTVVAATLHSTASQPDSSSSTAT